MSLYLVAYTTLGADGPVFGNCLREYPDAPEAVPEQLFEDCVILAMEYGLDDAIITHWGRLLTAEDFATPAGPFCYVACYHYKRGTTAGHGITSLQFVNPLLTMADVKRAEEIVRSAKQFTAVTMLSLSPSPQPWPSAVEWARSLAAKDTDQA